MSLVATGLQHFAFHVAADDLLDFPADFSQAFGDSNGPKPSPQAVYWNYMVERAGAWQLDDSSNVVDWIKKNILTYYMKEPMLNDYSLLFFSLLIILSLYFCIATITHWSPVQNCSFLRVMFFGLRGSQSSFPAN